MDIYSCEIKFCVVDMEPKTMESIVDFITDCISSYRKKESLDGNHMIKRHYYVIITCIDLRWWWVGLVVEAVLGSDGLKVAKMIGGGDGQLT
nr:hypothetical protein [Tanacetum cinerariifolium]